MEPVHIVLMGVSGSGKAALADELLRRTGFTGATAEELQPEEVCQKMAEGGFVSPDDRLPWAYAIRDWLTDQARRGNSTVVVSLGLGRRARDIFREAEGFVFFVHVEGTQDVIRERVRRKTGKLPDADEDEVLRRQYAELERLRADEPGVRVDATREPEVLADAALVALSVARKAGVDN
ncbi:AAA family ATPase [Corynebacterium variabile]|uniref:gluconokinase n=3 Tax=Corynebacterium variabile TaxID=1727 RepID=A0A0X2NNT0_9CORY|nr:AAA family ATPase [Corynebacterium variabile]AEK35933.1 putative carbohydrate kinase [Corynebacterium variabile DSM 44702]MDN6661321.1 AAA family ATPase [Corynebacterium variabile]CUU67106.1 Gluconate kinase [Corynebacterium variabile]